MASASSVILVALCSTIFVGCLATPTSRIVGGDESAVDTFPYVVSVRLDGAHVCGGSIIARNFILTAAHCVSEIQTTAVASNRVSVRAGSSNQFAGGTIVSTESIIIHASYGSFLYDVALLKLETLLDLGPRIQIIPLAESEDVISPGNVVTVPGWGRTAASEQNAYKLRYVGGTVLSDTDCEEKISYGYPSTLCIESEPGKGSCNGDAGGPAVFSSQLVGVSNFVIGSCGTKYPDVFARVSFFSSWINSIINPV